MCFPWNDEADEWWEMHPDWEVSSESSHNLCFSPMSDTAKADFFRNLHNIQYNSTNCADVTTKYMWSSGLGADFLNVQDGLAYSIKTRQPFQITLLDNDGGWHYAAYKKAYRNGRDPVCPSADMFCYFLPLGVCKPGPLGENAGSFWVEPHERTNPWLREYAMRPQQWIRKRVMEFAQSAVTPMPGENEKCAVFHIRRTDVVLHREVSRRYFPVEAYLEKLKESDPEVKDILLFTDDANAVDEAVEMHPDYNWMYIKKKRHRGSEGGWENQIPSDNAVDEFVSLMSIFKLASKCDIFVYGASGLADVIANHMEATGRPIDLIRVDENDEIFSINNTNSEMELQQYLQSQSLEAKSSDVEGVEPILHLED